MYVSYTNSFSANLRIWINSSLKADDDFTGRIICLTTQELGLCEASNQQDMPVYEHTKEGKNKSESNV